jgi:predicted AAA+ superfamily ATPase
LKGRRYATLDDFASLETAKTNPDALLEGGAPLTIDEAQRAPELLTAIKRRVDRDRTPGRFLLSGSANFALLKNVTESLAGRALYLTLRPFTLREASGKAKGLPFLVRFWENPHAPTEPVEPLRMENVFRGGMPPVLLDKAGHPDLWFKGYEQTYIDRDLRQLSQVADLLSFRRLMRLAALRTGQIMNVSELGRDAKLNAQTVGRYLNLLETSFLIHLLPPFLGNRSSRLIKSPKLYIADAGLAAHLTGARTRDGGVADTMRGPLFETFAAQNLMGLLEAHRPEASLLFWNVQGRHEVDFVIEEGRETMALEVKAAARWTESDLSGLRAFLESTPHCRAAVLAYNGPQAAKLGDRLWAVPLSTLLS